MAAHPTKTPQQAKLPTAAELAGCCRGRRVEAALSGGLDSAVLLHLLAEARLAGGFSLSAVHVHHGLSCNADMWADFCSRLCGRLNVPLRTVRVEVAASGEGLEAAARRARYRAFSDGLCDIVALAHHRDDQIETFMLAALRGGGLRAMAAMPKWRPLNDTTVLWRPLLDIPRSALEEYAARHGLDWVEDESNGDSRFLRNWLRREALPQWRRHVAHFDRQILADIESLQEDLHLLDEVAAEDYARICAQGWFDVGLWRGYSGVRRRRLLWQFAREHGLGNPPRVSVADFERVLSHLQTASAEWQLPKGKVYAGRGRLFAEPASAVYPWQTQPAEGRLKDAAARCGLVFRAQAAGLPQEFLERQVVIRSVRSGDTIAIRGGNKSVAKLLQEHRIPPFARKRWPVLAEGAGSRCAAVANLRVADGLAVSGGLLPCFEPFEKYIAELIRKQNV